MDIKLTQKNSVLKTAGTFCKEDINIDASALASGGGGVNFNLHVYGSAIGDAAAGNTKVEYSLDGADFVEFNDGQYQTTINLTGSCIILKVQVSSRSYDTYTGTNLLFNATYDTYDNEVDYRAYRPESNETISLWRMYD